MDVHRQLPRHTRVPFDQLPVVQRGVIPDGTFITHRVIHPDIPGWDKPGLPVPAMTALKARGLYLRGMIRLPSVEEHHLASAVQSELRPEFAGPVAETASIEATRPFKRPRKEKEN